MFNRYFQQELANLKDLGAEFSKAHPAIAPMLSGPAADPDVERLLEGVAFLTALLRQKLDDEFPEIIHDLMQLVCPHYLNPVPSTTMISFSLKPTLKQSVTVPAETYLSSVPVEGASCLFRTCYDVEMHPLKLLDASFSRPSGQMPSIRLLLELNGLKVSEWRPDSLRLYLAGDYSNAADIYLLLRNHLKRIVMKPVERGDSSVLSGEFLRPAGFSDKEAMIPYPSHAFPGYRILQEYFLSPEKFLFLDITGWERWSNRGDGSRFEVVFEFDELPFPPPRIKRDSFDLFVTPAVNIFPHEADPVLLDHRTPQYMIRPTGSNPKHFQVYSVEKVVGFIRGTAEVRTYMPFELFNADPQSNPVYHISRRLSPIHRGCDFHLSVAYPPRSEPPASETLSINLMCTNGSLPDKLQIGDISLPTSSSPEFVEFRNIQHPTANILPPLGTNLLWHYLSHLSLNYLSLANAENLRSLLELYIFPESLDQVATLANRKRISGIESVVANPANRLVSGIMMRGQEIGLKLRQDHFAGQGDMFLFGCVLDHFLGGYASINSFSSVVIEEIMKGYKYKWPARLGNHPLI